MRQDPEINIIPTHPTSRFVGRCTPCNYPVAVEHEDFSGDYLTVACPECGQVVIVERIYGTVTTEHVCDDSCQAAIGVKCVCSCGGWNHGIGFLVGRGESTKSAIAKFRASSAKRSESAKRVASVKRENKAAAKQAARAEWDAANGDVISWIDANDVSTSRSWGFASSLAEQLDRKGSLSEGQVAAVRRSIVRDAEWAEKMAAEAAKPKSPAPLGKGIAVTGVVLSVKDQDGHMEGSVTWKMRVQTADGWTVWSTVPQSIQDAFDADYRIAQDEYFNSGTRSAIFDGLATWLKGKIVTFTATLEASTRPDSRTGKIDPTFAIAKRPTKASVVVG